MTNVRGQVAAERELAEPAAAPAPLQPGFIDLPQKLLDEYKRNRTRANSAASCRIAKRLRDNVDRVIVLGIGGSYLGAKALFDALCHTYHNELPAKLRMGKPRIYFEGNNVDNDALQDLFELLENTCVDPDLVEERWGIVVISKSGGTLETAAAYRALKAEAAKFYGPKSRMLKQVIVPDHRDRRQAPRPVPGRRLRRRRHPHHPRRHRRPVQRVHRRRPACRPRSWASTSAPCCSAPRP